MSVAPNRGRRPNDPVLNVSDGVRTLNGGADVLTPRAGFYALQTIFNGAPSPSAPVVNRSKLTPISFPAGAAAH
jgi:hypothetical protein